MFKSLLLSASLSKKEEELNAKSCSVLEGEKEFALCNKERKIDDKYLDYKNKNVTNEFISYIKRLIKGKVDTFNEEGYIDFLSK